MSDWTKIEKEKEDWELEDRTEFGWFVSGWFYSWFRENLWKKATKTIDNWTKINKE